MNTKITKVCPHCGSTAVTRDATVAWSTKLQDWEVIGLHDGFNCEECSTELKDVEDKVIEVEGTFEEVTPGVSYILFESVDAPEGDGAKVKLTLITDEE